MSVNPCSAARASFVPIDTLGFIQTVGLLCCANWCQHLLVALFLKHHFVVGLFGSVLDYFPKNDLLMKRRDGGKHFTICANRK